MYLQFYESAIPSRDENANIIAYLKVRSRLIAKSININLSFIGACVFSAKKCVCAIITCRRYDDKQPTWIIVIIIRID